MTATYATMDLHPSVFANIDAATISGLIAGDLARTLSTYTERGTHNITLRIDTREDGQEELIPTDLSDRVIRSLDLIGITVSTLRPNIVRSWPITYTDPDTGEEYVDRNLRFSLVASPTADDVH